MPAEVRGLLAPEGFGGGEGAVLEGVLGVGCHGVMGGGMVDWWGVSGCFGSSRLCV